jgi:hypothetical protein
MVGAAALRNGLNVEYRSRNWKASPFAKPETIDTQRINRLCFKVTENGDKLEGSRTVFSNPSDSLIDEIFQLPNKVLALNTQYVELHNEGNNMDYTNPKFKKYMNVVVYDVLPIDFGFNAGHTFRKMDRYKSRIIDLGTEDNSIFVKGIRVQNASALYSYDLGLENVSPDRLFADREKILDSIEFLLKGCSNTAVIERILREAHQNPDVYYDEFEAFRDRRITRRGGLMGISPIYPRDTEFMEFHKAPTIDLKNEFYDGIFKALEDYADGVPENLWVKTFKSLYGKDAVIASFDTNINSDAEFMGYNPVKLNTGISNYLLSNGVLSADKIQNNQEYKWIDIGELTEPEKGMIDRVKDINQVIFGEPREVDVRVYSGLFLKSGREVTSSGGVHSTGADGKKYIGVKREKLRTLEDFTEVYIHEMGHSETGAGDADRRFTEFFVRALSRLSIYYMEQGK